MTEPDLSCLAESGEPAEAIYAWAWAMRPPTNGIKGIGQLHGVVGATSICSARDLWTAFDRQGFWICSQSRFQPVKNTMKNQGLWVTSRCA